MRVSGGTSGPAPALQNSLRSWACTARPTLPLASADAHSIDEDMKTMMAAR
jgi:hypothetical protein